MRILEIIQLRSTGKPLEFLKDQINESIGLTGKHNRIFTLYHREGLETDLAIHIRRDDVPGIVGPSALGLRLASALKVYGLVEHTVWKELK